MQALEVLPEAICAAADAMVQSLLAEGKILACGNGGSAGDSQHFAAEMLNRFERERPALPAIALTTDTSVLTAIGNDYGFELVFERQVRGLGRRGDILLAISTSGRSPNMLRALEAARALEMTLIGFTSQKGAAMTALCDLALVVPSEVTQLIQQVHITAAHIICELVEADMFGKSH
jgi:D-sedoheptulose 7-phosphate isomerase